jgi:hypothetical protein
MGSFCRHISIFMWDSGASVPPICLCYKYVNKEAPMVLHSTVCKALNTKLPRRDCRQYGDARCNGDNI